MEIKIKAILQIHKIYHKNKKHQKIKFLKLMKRL